MNNFDRLVADFEAGLSDNERELYNAFGESFSVERELRALRRAAGLTQTQLAAVSGVPQPEISRYENGRTEPTYPRLRRLVRAMGGDVPILPPAVATAFMSAAESRD